MSTVPTWPGVWAVSRASNDTSRAVRRCGMIRPSCGWELVGTRYVTSTRPSLRSDGGEGHSPMTGSPTGRRAAALVFSGALAALALTGCTSPPTGAASPSPEVTSAPASPSATVSASPSAAESPSPTPSEPSAADSVSIDITIADGQVDPNGEKINVEVGQTILLNVTSDEHEAV